MPGDCGAGGYREGKERQSEIAKESGGGFHVTSRCSVWPGLGLGYSFFRSTFSIVALPLASKPIRTIRVQAGSLPISTS